MNKNKKIGLVSSSGGHLEQLKQLIPMLQEEDVFIVTEWNKTTKGLSSDYKTHFLVQQERKNITFILNLLKNTIRSLRILRREQPEVIISTGAGATIPFLVIGKVMGSRVIFIESFAKISSPTLTGRIIYHIADQFYIQWPSMEKFYPKALYRGKIY
ncbi:PssD/Cps14F family polysaccharide biosynthesis glycosyltransferase [Halobacillus sp. Cin3]|uniref:PssD/Cps14F family polysaccharide biosynthesis glycosyltransferase n=1 Tax=Halobacillus sp. Cin3 TaxID=2928441 RepID=UPI00248D4A1B|nr:PssD/Cps14F family polysaccharide biosynthesis glycosyltransferase [Halobacillus sp. Cin3]